MSKQYQVVIAGAGITGLSAALHLILEGASSVLIIAPDDIPPSSARSPGWIVGGQRDNFTRVAQAHQPDFAMELWRFGDRAFDRTLAWARQHHVPVNAKRRLRLIVTPEELTEARSAVVMMKSCGIAADLIEGSALAGSPWNTGTGERVLAIQDDGERGGWIDACSFHDKLAHAVTATKKVTVLKGRVDHVSGYGEPSLTVSTTLSTGVPQKIQAGAFVAACHLHTGDVIPELKSALVSVADQWLTIQAPPISAGRKHPWQDAGVAWSAMHTHEWGVTAPGNRWLLGGGRVLRKWAGFEATEAKAEPNISRHVIAQAKKTFTSMKFPDAPEANSEGAGLDCYPCDELPVIGPMFGEGRILVAAGFMGQGITLGFEAGRCLARLLMTGSCPELPRRLWPERLRSLPEGD
ncbi:MAG: hypothetical protein RIQ81_1853 [Pseudomonadota bacterium]